MLAGCCKNETEKSLIRLIKTTCIAAFSTLLMLDRIIFCWLWKIHGWVTESCKNICFDFYETVIFYTLLFVFPITSLLYDVFFFKNFRMWFGKCLVSSRFPALCFSVYKSQMLGPHCAFVVQELKVKITPTTSTQRGLLRLNETPFACSQSGD